MDTRTPETDRVFEELYRSFSGDVFRFTLYLCGNWALAQDLTSETFVRAWTTGALIRAATAKAYLFVIARNLYLDHVRSRKPEPDHSAAAPAAFVARENPALSLEQRQELSRTIADLERLPEGDRAALVMAVFEELSYDQVAAALEISVNAVKARVFRARLRLAELRKERNQE